AEQMHDRKWNCRAGYKSNDRADHGQPDDLRQIDRKHVAAGAADRLEGRDDVTAPVYMALHGVGNADTADQQRRESDECEELREAADGAFELRRGVVAR